MGFAVTVEETVAHPGDPMTAPVVAALGLGVALLVASSALSLWRLGGPVLVPRLVVLAVMALGLALAAPLPPAWPLGVVAAGLLAIVLIEEVAPPDGPSRATTGR